MGFFFNEPSKQPLRKIAIHNETGDVYVCGLNDLYHLSATLDFKDFVSLGPNLDHPDCLHPSYPCTHNKSMTNYECDVLEIIQQRNASMLLICGEVYRGVCQLRPLYDLHQTFWVEPLNETVGFTAGPRITRTFFGPGIGGQWSLYTGTNTHPLQATGYFPDYISSRILVEEYGKFRFKYSSVSNNGTSSINLQGMDTPRGVVYGFIYEDFAYFVIIHQELGLPFRRSNSKLARVCVRDKTFESYTELPIGYYSNDSKKMYDFALDAYLGPASIHLTSETNKALYVTFAHKDANDSVTESVICGYPMARIISSFIDVTRDCHRTRPTAALLQVDKTQFLPCKKELFLSDYKNYCVSRENRYIIGSDIIPAKLVLEETVVVTAIAVFQQHRTTVAFYSLGTASGGYIVKVNLDIVPSGATEYKTFETVYRQRLLEDVGQMRAPIHFDPSKEHIFLHIRNKVIRFPISTCSVYGDCETCLSVGQKDPLSCGWCGDHCARRPECQRLQSFVTNSCQAIILDISPLKGPKSGGTELVIIGENFELDKLSYEVFIAGYYCNVTFWSMNKLKCIVSASSLEVSGPVEIRHAMNRTSNDEKFYKQRITQSSQNFSFVDTRLFGLHPGKGSINGGTNVTVFGQNLNIGMNYSMSICRVECSNFRISATSAWCITGRKHTVDCKIPVEIAIDSAVVGIEDNATISTVFGTTIYRSYSYLPDPKITSLKHAVTTISGIMNVSVDGINLDSATNPTMIVEVMDRNGEKMEFRTTCSVSSDGTEMTCPTPPLTSPDIPIPQRNKPLIATLTFDMDGGWGLGDFRLFYYPDPEYQQLPKILKIMENATALEIKGRNMDLVLSSSDTQVFVGGENCIISKLLQDSLTCSLSPELMSDSNAMGTNLSIEVVAGSLKHHLGHLEIIQNQVSVREMSVGEIITLVILVFCGAAAIFIFYRCYKIHQKRPFHHLDRNEDGDGNALSVNVYHQVIRTSINSNPSSRDSHIAHTSLIRNQPETRGVRSSQSLQPRASQIEMAPLIDQETMNLFEVENLLIKQENLVIGEEIGSGNFGRVFSAVLRYPENGRQLRVAVKTLRNTTGLELQGDSFLKEAKLMKNFNHPNVLTLVGVCFSDRGHPMVALPFMDRGSLKEYIVSNPQKKIYVSELLKFAIDVASGMTYLAQEKYVHRDLACRNCMLDSNLQVKVGDFGLSRDIYTTQYYRSTDRQAELPVKWMAPESLETSCYSEETDVWSYGVLLWELMTLGGEPYCAIHNWDVLDFLKTGRRLPRPRGCEEPVYEAMLSCWDIDPNKRPFFREIVDFLRRIRLSMSDDRINS